MPPEIESIARSPVATLSLALAIIGSFITGTIVSGRVYERLLASMDKLTSAVETQNALTKQALSNRNDQH